MPPTSNPSTGVADKTKGSGRRQSPVAKSTWIVRTITLMLISSVVTLQVMPRDCSLMNQYAEAIYGSVPSFLSDKDMQQDTSVETMDDFQLARDQSHGFFDDIPSADWKLFQQRARTHIDHPDPNRPNGRWPKTPPAVFYMSNYDPIFTCPHERRLGGVGDGPKWTCDPHRFERIAQERAATAALQPQERQHFLRNNKNDTFTTPSVKPQTNCLVYSVGCAGKYQWEEALAKTFMGEGGDSQRVCDIHVFDFTKDFTVEGHAEKLNIHFHQWGLKSSYDTSLESSILSPPKQAQMYTLEQVMEKLGHTGQIIDILKIDCEFCEWFTYKDWLDPAKADVRQLLIETHNLPNPHDDPHKNQGGHWFPTKTQLTPSQFFDDIEQAGFAMYSKEPNIHPQAGGNGVEFAYIKLHPDFFKAEN